jgi:hypothetical protein
MTPTKQREALALDIATLREDLGALEVALQNGPPVEFHAGDNVYLRGVMIRGRVMVLSRDEGRPADNPTGDPT